MLKVTCWLYFITQFYLNLYMMEKVRRFCLICFQYLRSKAQVSAARNSWIWCRGLELRKHLMGAWIFAYNRENIGCYRGTKQCVFAPSKVIDTLEITHKQINSSYTSSCNMYFVFHEKIHPSTKEIIKRTSTHSSKHTSLTKKKL